MPENAEIRLDMHLHTHVSKDSIASPRDICKKIKKVGLSGLSLTDHNSYANISAMKKTCKEYGLYFIEGIEIYTNLGEVLVYFATEHISMRDLDYDVICEDVRSKDGIIVIPHPYDTKRKSRLKIDYINPNTLKKFTDGLEVYNSRVINPKKSIERTLKLKNKLEVFETGGSDGHQPREVGHAYTIVDPNYSVNLNDDDELKKIFKMGKVSAAGKMSNPLVHAVSFVHKWSKVVNKKITGRPAYQ